MSRLRLTILLGATALGASAAALPHNESGHVAQPTMKVTLRPKVDLGGGVGAIDVTVELGGVRVDDGAPFALRIPIEFAGIQHVADRIENLEVKSPAGVVRLNRVDEPPDAGGSLYWRRWEIAQPVPAQLTVRYRARLDPPHPWPGPPFDLRSNGGGVSGAGYGFLVLPDSKDSFVIDLEWDLREMRAGARALASVGEGDAHLDGPVDRLQECFYMAGQFGSYPDDASASRFRSAWLGIPPFDAKREMQWSARAYQALQSFFGDTSTTPFYFLMRAGRDNQSTGGAALANSFLLFTPAAGAAPTDDPPSLTIAHEITHHFAHGLTAPEGIEGSWFSEGLAEYYSRLVTFRARLISPSDFAKEVNESAQAYYTNPERTLPNDSIAQGFWRDKNVQGLPYQRGYFYFVDVNQKLLAASGGKVSVDTVVLALLARAERDDDLTPDTWVQAVRQRLGAAGAQEFESVIMHGDVVVPTSDAFGPCFERRTVQMGTYELGFDRYATLQVQPRVVRGVAPGSAAERAGLRNGDTVVAVEPAAIEALRYDMTKRIHLRVKRGTRALEIEYLPRSKPVQGYQWARRTGVPDDACVAPL